MQFAEGVDFGLDVWGLVGDEAELTAWCILWLMPWKTYHQQKIEGILERISDGLTGR